MGIVGAILSGEIQSAMVNLDRLRELHVEVRLLGEEQTQLASRLLRDEVASMARAACSSSDSAALTKLIEIAYDDMRRRLNAERIVRDRNDRPLRADDRVV